MNNTFILNKEIIRYVLFRIQITWNEFESNVVKSIDDFININDKHDFSWIKDFI